MVDVVNLLKISSHKRNCEKLEHNIPSYLKHVSRPVLPYFKQQNRKTKESDIKISPSVIRNVPILSLYVSLFPVMPKTHLKMSDRCHIPKVQSSNHRLKGISIIVTLFDIFALS